MKEPTLIFVQYININVSALKRTGLSHDEYCLCYVIEQFQRYAGWVECGVGNQQRSIYRLKIHIAEQAGLDEQTMNRRFRALRAKGYIDVSPDKQKFRLTAKYFVFSPDTDAELNRHIESELHHTETEHPRKTNFAQSPYANDFARFERDMRAIKSIPPNADLNYYFKQIQHYYTVEHPERCFVDWRAKCRHWIEKDMSANCLRTLPQEATAPPQLSQQNDAELSAAVELFYSKIKTPEAETFDAYVETGHTFVALLKEALRRGNRILDAKGRDSAQRFFKVFADKAAFRALFEKQTALAATIADDIKDLVRKMTFVLGLLVVA